MLRRLAALVLCVGLAGCALEFGGDSDPRSVRERSRLYMQEQERLERDRQLFQTSPGSER
jgi:hypothetical protein